MARALTPAQLAAALGELGDPKVWDREIKAAYRPIARQAGTDVRARMRASGDRGLVAAARAVSARTSTVGAAVAVTAGRAVPQALAKTWGMKRRTGWNAMVYAGRGKPVRMRAMRPGTRPQNPPWVGASWQVAVKGEGPRGVNDALADGIHRYRAQFADAASNLMDRYLRP